MVAFEAKSAFGQIDHIDVDARRSRFTHQRADVDTAPLGGTFFLRLAGGVNGYQERPRRQSF